MIVAESPDVSCGVLKVTTINDSASCDVNRLCHRCVFLCNFGIALQNYIKFPYMQIKSKIFILYRKTRIYDTLLSLSSETKKNVPKDAFLFVICHWTFDISFTLRGALECGLSYPYARGGNRVWNDVLYRTCSR